jgi:hypothetical protein
MIAHNSRSRGAMTKLLLKLFIVLAAAITAQAGKDDIFNRFLVPIGDCGWLSHHGYGIIQWLARDKAAIAALAAVEDQAAGKRMVKNGELLEVREGTKLCVMDTWYQDGKYLWLFVRILDGQHKGKTAWVPGTFVTREAPAKPRPATASEQEEDKIWNVIRHYERGCKGNVEGKCGEERQAVVNALNKFIAYVNETEPKDASTYVEWARHTIECLGHEEREDCIAAHSLGDLQNDDGTTGRPWWARDE